MLKILLPHRIADADYALLREMCIRDRGSPELLMQTCAELGLGCDIIPKVELGGITVSSSRCV